MTDNQGLIILKYEPGPVAGTCIVWVDAPGYTQAPFVMDERFKGTPDEYHTLRRMLEDRRNIAEVSKEKGI